MCLLRCLNVFLNILSIRRYVSYFRKETLIDQLHSLFTNSQDYGFNIIAVEPHEKDGGVFIRFSYDATANTEQDVLQRLKELAAKHGGIPSWNGLLGGDIWPVKGKPWREVRARGQWTSIRSHSVFETARTWITSHPQSFESRLMARTSAKRISMSCSAYAQPPLPRWLSSLIRLQPYGRIQDLSQPTPPPVAGGLRFSTVTFSRMRSAAIARNSVHGLAVQPPSSSAKTILRTTYQAPVQAHAVRDYIGSHPRIFLPVLFFLLGTLTYTVRTSSICVPLQQPYCCEDI